MKRGNNLLCAWFDGKLNARDAEVVVLRFAAIMVFIIEAWLSHTPGPASSQQSQALSRWSGVDEELLRRLAHPLLFLTFVFAGSGWGWPGIAGTAAWSGLDEVTKG